MLSSTQGLFEDAEAKRGLQVKKADFEAYLKKISFPTLLLCVIVVFPLEMGQNQQSSLNNRKMSTNCPRAYNTIALFTSNSAILSGDC